MTPLTPWPGIMRAYRRFIPFDGDDAAIVTLLEGNTPLVEAPRLARALGEGVRLWLKLEGQNPTGSFKDRGMTVAVTRARARGARVVLCASTGNTSASAAAYAARAGMRAVVVVPGGKVALGKLSQARMHGAEVLQIDGSFDEALRLVREIAASHPVALVNSVNPDRIEGQMTAAYEICDALGGAPDLHALPVGNAGNITAYWRGYVAYERAGLVRGRPRMLGVQAEGAAPIVRGRPVERPETVATAIRIGNPASWSGALAARDESGGAIISVSDAELLEAYRRLAAEEGVFCEPASAAGVAGLFALARLKRLPPGARIVCTITGHGLKDPDVALAEAAGPAWTVGASREAIVRALGL
ncbi:MAG TPA: threonine synthase [Thermodesulfobacteriota bacterium]|nr:threonine synthase [Thermodesulfobacteriota bacterium]